MKKLLSVVLLGIVVLSGCNLQNQPKDEVLVQINQILEKFEQNHAANYIKSDSVDYTVAAALRHLNVLDKYLSNDALSTFVTKEKLESVDKVGDAFKYSVILQAKKQDITTYHQVNLVNKIVEINAIGPWQSLYGVMALNGNDKALAQDYIDRAVADMTIDSKPKTATVDTGGTTLIALAPYYNSNQQVKEVIDEYVNWISLEEQQANGEVKDTWSGANSSTIAQVIMGLVANNIDPRGKAFTKENGDLVTALLKYATGDGSFKWLLTDENSDLFFSTQQSILALAVYKNYKLNKKAVNAYMFK